MAARFYDCHTHLFPADRMGSLMRWIHRAILDFQVPVDITASEAVKDLRRSGAVRWANLLFPISPEEAPILHSWNRELADQVPEITPFGGVHIEDEDPLGVVQEAVEKYGMAGLKFHPMVQGFDPWHWRLSKVLCYLDDIGLPIYIHTGYDKWYGQELDRSGMEQLLETYPGMPVVVSHMGFPDLKWGFALAERFPQVWLDLTNVPGSLALMNRPDKLLVEFRDGLAKYRDRTLMGTDYPAGTGNLEEIVAQFESIGVDEGLLEDIMMRSTKSFFDRYGKQPS